jgi:hypothetical protein
MPSRNTQLGLIFLLAICLGACRKEDLRLHNTVVEGTVLGPGCRTGSFAIGLKGKNRYYGIDENASFDNIVETTTLPEMYQISGTRIFFRFSVPATDEADQYLTYCTPPPQITIVAAATNPRQLDSSVAE